MFKFIQTQLDSVNKVGVAFTVLEFQVKVGKRVNNEMSVYITCELLAILLAVVLWVGGLMY